LRLGPVMIDRTGPSHVYPAQMILESAVRAHAREESAQQRRSHVARVLPALTCRQRLADDGQAVAAG
jgi:hypothetical protein